MATNAFRYIGHDSLRNLTSGIVRGYYQEIGALGRSLTHERALAAITISPATKYADDLAELKFIHGN